jgi:hypothetical protein
MEGEVVICEQNEVRSEQLNIIEKLSCWCSVVR